MSLFISALNSGSNGNCYYIGNSTEAVLIDAGISCRETEKRMRRNDLKMDRVKAIFISHEHADHIRGVEVLSARYQIPVYITTHTLKNSALKLEAALAMPLQAYSPVTIGDLTIHTFPKLHDAIDPHSFIIKGNNVTIGVFTDIGTPCQHVASHFNQCHAAFLEANYDDEMLENGRYPFHLKKRIRGNHGHLSNRQAVDLFLQHRPSFMTHLLLSHLSKDNNDPQLVLDAFAPHAGTTHVAVASRYEESPVYEVHGRADTPLAPLAPAAPKPYQIPLFG